MMCYTVVCYAILYFTYLQVKLLNKCRSFFKWNTLHMQTVLTHAIRIQLLFGQNEINPIVGFKLTYHGCFNPKCWVVGSNINISWVGLTQCSQQEFDALIQNVPFHMYIYHHKKNLTLQNCSVISFFLFFIFYRFSTSKVNKHVFFLNFNFLKKLKEKF